MIGVCVIALLMCIITCVANTADEEEMGATFIAPQPYMGAQPAYPSAYGAVPMGYATQPQPMYGGYGQQV